jgi:tetratricopeptide (TPR) repeat protein
MRPIVPYKTIAIGLTLLVAGCRLPYRDGPIPQSVAESRRLSQQGAAALDRGQQKKAETLLAQAVNAWPTDPEARRHYAESLWQRGDRTEAILQLEEANRLAPDDSVVLARLAEMYLATGKFNQARQDADRAIALDPKLPQAWAARGGALQATGQLEAAQADFLRALNYAPKDRGILMSVALLYQQQHQPERALQTLQSLADTYMPGEEPGHVFFMLGQTYATLGRVDEGVENLKIAITREKPTPEMFYTLGEVELMAGHPVEAATAARQALTLQPKHQLSRDLLNRIELAQQPSRNLQR